MRFVINASDLFQLYLTMSFQLGVVQRRIVQYHHIVDTFKLDLHNLTFV